MHHSWNALVDLLSTRLKQPLPGHDAHVTMAPRYSTRRKELSVRGKDCRHAGVLAALLHEHGETKIVLTVRRKDLQDHAGQISFPGGQQENDETLRETALREAEEEIGLPPASVHLLGVLTPLYIPPSNFCVHPYVGAVYEPPPLRPTDEEVQRVLRVPLSRLLDPKTRTEEPWTLHGTVVDVPFYDLDGVAVWGATAMMLAELLSVIREIDEDG